jgi:ribonuclease E
VIRAVEDRLMAGEPSNLVALTTPSAALYILNQKRHFLNDMEARYGVTITVTGSEKVQGASFQIERGPQLLDRAPARPKDSAIQMGYGHSEVQLGADEEAEEEEDALDSESAAPEEAEAELEGEDEPRRRRRRRRRGRGDRLERHAGQVGEHTNGNGREEEFANPQLAEPVNGDTVEDIEEDGDDEAGEDAEAGSERREGASHDASDRQGRRGRRRGRRGGRRRRERGERQDISAQPVNPMSDPASTQPLASGIAAWDSFEPTIGELAAAERKSRGEASDATAADTPPADMAEAPEALKPAPIEPRQQPERIVAPVEEQRPEPSQQHTEAAPAPLPAEPAPEAIPPPVPIDEAKPRRTGWWQRR